MDYKTKPTDRETLRKLAQVFDRLVNTQGLKYKPVVELLDKVTDIMPFVHYEIVEDDVLPYNVPGRGRFLVDGTYQIQIKESIYLGAIEGIGAYRDHIMHEIFHPFMMEMGFVPCLDRSFTDNTLDPYESCEWQVKAITGEYLMDYEMTKGMTVDEIVSECGVSRCAARKRKTY